MPYHNARGSSRAICLIHVHHASTGTLKWRLVTKSPSGKGSKISELMTIAQQWKEEGMQIGEQKGHQEAMQEFASRLLQKSMSNDEIVSLTGLPLASIQALRTKKTTH